MANNAEYYRQWRERRKAEGLCIRCGTPTSDGGCLRCRDDARLRVAAHRARKRRRAVRSVKPRLDEATSYRRIAKELGIPRSAVAQAEQSALRKIRAACRRYDITMNDFILTARSMVDRLSDWSITEDL